MKSLRGLGFSAVATVAFVVGSAMSARAQDIPRYDPPGHCREVADTVGGSAMILNGCIQQEQDAYDALKAAWDAIPSRTAGHCDEVARTIGGSYQILLGCIRQEVDAASNPTEFRF